jgi:hypothetical protein
MCAAKCPSRVLKGLSFEVDDLIFIKDQSATNDLRMVVQLDHRSDVEEYEEVLVFYPGTSPQWCWMMWRNASAVFVRSIDGRGRRYETASRAIEALLRKPRATITDITARAHPALRSMARGTTGLTPPRPRMRIHV